MRKIWFIAQKELSGYFRSPMAYIVLVLAISIFNFFFFVIIDTNQEASLRDVFQVMQFMLLFFVPIMTMKTFAEEKMLGTMEFLTTTPTTITQITLGKYLGSFLFFMVLVLLTGVYYCVIEAFASIDRMAVLSGYVGFILQGAFLIAIGIMASSWTQNQMVAAIISYTILFALYFLLSLTKYVAGPVEEVVRYLSTLSHVENFSVGLIVLSDVVYYITGIILCLIVTRFSLKVQFWK